jgi:hypothetical protein
MLSVIIGGLIILAVCIFPVMFVAKKLGAQKSELIDCIIAVVVGGLVSGLVVSMFTDPGASTAIKTILSITITGVVYKFLLEATYIKGILIALIPSVFYLVVGKVLA